MKRCLPCYDMPKYYKVHFKCHDKPKQNEVTCHNRPSMS